MSYLTETYNQVDTVVYDFDTESQLPFVSRRLGRPSRVNVFYSDVNANFTRNKSDLIVYEETTINLQINNVLSTPIGSDEFEPEFGSLLPFRLQDTISNRLTGMLRNDTIEALRRWLSDRITLDLSRSSVRVMNDNPDYEGYIIDISFRVNRNSAVRQYSVAMVR
mgnify:CR=1 FL=1